MCLDTLTATPSANSAYRWAHLDLEAPGTRDWIATHVDSTVAQSLTAEDTRPRCTRHDRGILINLRGVNLNPDSEPEDMVSIRMWLCDRAIISARRRRLRAVVALRETIESGNGPHSVGNFITKLAVGLTISMDGVISDLGDKVDLLEETSIDRPQGLRAQLADLRRTTIALRRYIGPQREALAQLAIIGLSEMAGGPLLDPADQIHLRETIDQITRIVEELDAIRERCAILHDQLTDQRAEEMNRNMMILSVVAAIFLPLGFLTGLLGVNIGGIPGANFPGAFTIFCLMLISITGGLYWWFRKKKWI